MYWQKKFLHCSNAVVVRYCVRIEAIPRIRVQKIVETLRAIGAPPGAPYWGAYNSSRVRVRVTVLHCTGEWGIFGIAALWNSGPKTSEVCHGPQHTSLYCIVVYINNIFTFTTLPE